MKKRMRKLLISSLTLAMLLVNSLNVFAAETSEDQTTNVDVPLGVTSEHTMDVESIPAETAEAVLNVTFATVKGEYVGSTTVKESAPNPEPTPTPDPKPTPDQTTPVNPTPVKPAVEKDNNKTNDNTNKKVDTADKKTTKTEAPKTGDTANIAMNVFVMAICGAAIVTVIFRKRFTRR